MDTGKLFQIITNSTLLATRLLSSESFPNLRFLQPIYCISVPEDAPRDTLVGKVEAVLIKGHSGHSSTIRYAITEGNDDRLFSVGGRTGELRLSSTLDYENKKQHDLIVAAESDGDLALTSLRIIVENINDNPPKFVDFVDSVTVIEEDDRDLPKVLMKVTATDADGSTDEQLLFTVEGDGVNEREPIRGTFLIHPSSGELLQIKPLDRDSPNGKPTWKLKIRVFDGQTTTTKMRPNYLSNFENIIQHSKNENPFQSQILFRIPKVAGKSVNRHRRDVYLLTTKLSSTSTADKYVENVDENAPYVSRREKNFTSGKRLENLIKITRAKTDITSTKRIKEGVSPKRRRRANIRGDTKMLPRYLSQNTFSRAFTATTPNRLPISIRAPSAVKIGEKAKHRIEMKENGYNNVIKNDVDNDLDTMKFSQNVSNCHLSKNNNNKFIPRHSFGGKEVTKYFEKLNKSVQKSRENKKLCEFLCSNRKKVNSALKRLDYKISVRNRLICFHNDGLKLEFNCNKNKTKRKETSFKFSGRLFHFYPRRFRESIGYPFTYKINKKSDSESDTRNVLNFKHIWDINKDLIIRSQASFISSIRERGMKTVKENNGSQHERKWIMSDIPYTPRKTCFNKFVGRKLSKRSLILPRDLACPSISYSIEPQTRNKIHVLEKEFTVFVKDINDNTPKFSLTTFRMSVEENGIADEVVGMVTAFDADDVTFGTNALLTYSLEKNVVEEHTGERLFKINSTSGEIRTALCCLDREVTSTYRLQVVATDGGGLQGTATVVVRVEDHNDNAPKFVKEEWTAILKETFGRQIPSNETILEASVTDPDLSNHFAYRIIQSSGAGWQLFNVDAKDRFCRIYATSPLDYEDGRHRNGFRFKIQVSDQGEKNWVDPRHTDTAWVRISLLDINDHSPSFNVSHKELSLREDTEIGTKVILLAAKDLDSGANGNVSYAIDDPFGSFRIDDEGAMWIENALDREGPAGPKAEIRVIATDNGSPPLTETAAVSVKLLDVNDCAPSLVSSRVYHVRENVSPLKVGVLLATDRDEDNLDHGPPFKFKVAATTPKKSSENVTIKFNPNLDSGRGGGEIWTLTSLDREKQSEILMDVHISDVTGLWTNQGIKIIVDDVNDNRMLPGSKLVYVLKPKAMVSDYRLGRVFVNDLDDWDMDDKTFHWVGEPHPQFLLDGDLGILYASNDLPDGRYDLRLKVSDHFWQQFNVEANVSVLVKTINPDTFIHAISVSLYSISPTRLVKDWTPMEGGGLLGSFVKAVRHSLKHFVGHVDVVSVEENPLTVFNIDAASTQSSCRSLRAEKFGVIYPSGSQSATLFKESSKVWIAASLGGNYLDPVKLRGLLELKMDAIAQSSSLIFSLEDRIKNTSTKSCFSSFSQFSVLAVSPLYESSFSSNNFQMQVVDMNSTSLVTTLLSTPSFPCLSKTAPNPFSNSSFTSFSSQLHITSPLLTPSHDQRSTFCTRNYCLNGGRCVPTETSSRCICPGGTIGRRCKVISRTFSRGGWVWLPRLPSCLPLRISLRFVSLHDDGLIMYQGPLSSKVQFDPRLSRPIPIFILHLEKGVLLLTLEHAGMKVELTVANKKSLADGKWHSLHIRITEELIDLGEPAYSSNSKKHCQVNKKRLCDQISSLFWNSSSEDHCKLPSNCAKEGENGRGGYSPFCHCYIWAVSSPYCESYKRAVTLGVRSYSSIALSFVPNPRRISIQLKFKTATEYGLLVKLASRKARLSLSLHISNGYLCLSFSTSSSNLPLQPLESKSKKISFSPSVEISNSSFTKLFQQTSETGDRTSFQSKFLQDDVSQHSSSLCLTKKPVTDGAWHSVFASRLGHNLVLQIDDGEDWQYNETLPLFEAKKITTPPLDFWVDVREGVLVGGVPEYIKRNVSLINQDLNDTCLDDLRISGQQLPLAPSVNNTNYGQVTTMQGMRKGCHFSPKINCINTNCPSPFECRDVQGQAVCGCKTGQVLTPSGCRNMELCLFSPCLNGGTCQRTDKGFSCFCPTGLTGKYCEWDSQIGQKQGLNMIFAVAIAVSLVVVFITAITCFLCINRRRKMLRRKGSDKASTLSIAGFKKVKGVENSPVIRIKTVNQTSVLLPQDDLRNYAYEGEGSSAESLGSVFTGIHNEIGDPLEMTKIDPSLCEVIDLLKGLPDAAPSPFLPKSRASKTTELSKSFKSSPSTSSSNRKQNPHPPDGSVKIINSPTAETDPSPVLQSKLSDFSPGKTVSV